MFTSLENLPEIRKKHSEDTIVLAGGVFDLVHPGHLDLFKRMKTVASIGVVAVSTDTRVRQRKGSDRPIQDENTRLQVVEAMRSVDYAMIAPEPNGLEVPTVRIMRALRPDFFMSSEDSWLNFPHIFEELGVEFSLVPRLSEDVSTTQTIHKITGIKTT